MGAVHRDRAGHEDGPLPRRGGRPPPGAEQLETALALVQRREEGQLPGVDAVGGLARGDVPGRARVQPVGFLAQGGPALGGEGFPDVPDVEATAERVAGRVDDHDEPLVARARHRDGPAGDHEVDVLAPQGVEGRLGGRAEAGEEPMHVHIPQLVVPERGRVLEDRPFREVSDRFPGVGVQELDDGGGIGRMDQQVHVRTAAVLRVDAGLRGVALDVQAANAGPVQQMRDAGVGEADADLEVQGRRGGRSLSRRSFSHGRELSRPKGGPAVTVPDARCKVKGGSGGFVD